jgi:pyridoxine/pyridoxamine 5'-phosphate oxidase
MSGDQIDLYDIEARAKAARIGRWAPHERRIAAEDVPALVARVRRLEAKIERMREASMAPPGWGWDPGQ